MKTSKSITSFKWYALTIGIFWTIFILITILVSTGWFREKMYDIARVEAKTAFEKYVVFRRWVGEHGGVYVPITSKTPPNQYLSMIPDRDVITTAGKELTLMNPAYVTRQVYELMKGVNQELGHITSLKPIRPENKADEWETKALQHFASSEAIQDTASIEMMGGRQYLRYMKPLKVEEGCMNCHHQQGYNLGDIRGGISVSVPMDSYNSILKSNILGLHIVLSLIWLFGATGIYFGYRHSRRSSISLQKNERMYRNILENLTDIYFRTDNEGVVTLVSPSILRVLEYSSMDEIIGKRASDFWANPELSTDIVNRIKQNGKVVDQEVTLLTKNGKSIDFSTNCNFYIDENEIVAGIEGILRDITERKKAEEELQESENKFRSFLHQAGDGFELLDFNARFIDVNEATCRMMGYSKEEMLKLSIPEIDPVVDLERFRSTFLSLVGKPPITFESKHIKKDGVLFSVEITSSVIQIRKENFLFSLVRDISDRKKVEETLRESEERYKRMVETSRDFLFITQLDDKGNSNIVNINSAGCQMFGYTYDELINSDVGSLYAEAEKRKLVRDLLLEKGFIENLELKGKKKDGTIFDVSLNAVGRWDQNGKGMGAQGSIRDLTIQKIIEEERSKRQKIEFLTTIAGGIGHDFNNYLTSILGNISLFLEKYGHLFDEKGKQYIYRSMEACERTKTLAGKLLTFTKSGDPVKKVVKLTKSKIDESVQFGIQGLSVVVEYDIKEELLPVEIDEKQIGQVFLNLAINAAQAMSKGGKIFVSAQNVEIPQVNKMDLHEGTYVRISFQDTGCGMSPELLSKIFDPYFTTKEAGTGLGLAIVYSIVKKHGGNIQVYSEEGKGTDFHIYLPTTKKMNSVLKQEDDQNIYKQTGRVLVLEDDINVAEITESLLTTIGFEVTLTSEGKETLERYRKSFEKGNPYDAVLMDVTIKGGLGAVDIIKPLREIDPNVKAIVTSGYTVSGVLANYKENGFAGAIPKPFVLKEIAMAMNEVLSKK